MLTVEVGVLMACVTELGGSVAATVAAALVGPDAPLHGWSSGSTLRPIKSRSKGLRAFSLPHPLILQCLLIQNMFSRAINLRMCNSPVSCPY